MTPLYGTEREKLFEEIMKRAKATLPSLNEGEGRQKEENVSQPQERENKTPFPSLRHPLFLPTYLAILLANSFDARFTVNCCPSFSISYNLACKIYIEHRE
jgi:hypothetical protein